MKKVLIVIASGVLIGGIFSLYVFKDIKKTVALSIDERHNVVAFQAGVFNIYENALKEKNKHAIAYIYSDKDKYRVYLAIYNNKEIIDKLSNYYNEQNISYYKRTIKVSEVFYSKLKKYEDLLKSTSDIGSYLQANKSILEEYGKSI